MVKALADRLAEAFAEYLHAQAREDWGYGAGRAAVERGADRARSIAASARRPAIPPARTTPRRASCSSCSTRGRQGITLTESFAMLPAASVSGLYFAHPQARYFNVGRIGRDQVESYAKRKGMSIEEAERWLGAEPGLRPGGAWRREMLSRMPGKTLACLTVQIPPGLDRQQLSI